jgi:uncharacterized protein (TIGR00730 family)
MRPQPATIAIFASSSTTLPPTWYSHAESLGKKLTGAGYAIVYGGGNNGLMGSLARGAAGRGGKLTGVIPRPLQEAGYCFEEAREIIVTETLAERKRIMHERADAFIALPGGYGTFDELFGVIAEKQLSFHDKPVVLWDIDSFFGLFTAFTAALREKNCIGEIDHTLYEIVKTEDELLARLAKYFSV